MTPKHILAALIFWAMSITVAQAQTADETAIKAVCEAETRTWLDGNKKGHDACWHIQPYSLVMVSLPDGTFISVSGTDINAIEEKAMGGGGTFSNTNYVVKVNGNTAWASFDQAGADGKGNKKTSKELRILEKVGDSWKIVVMNAHLYTPK